MGETESKSFKAWKIAPHQSASWMPFCAGIFCANCVHWPLHVHGKVVAASNNSSRDLLWKSMKSSTFSTRQLFSTMPCNLSRFWKQMMGPPHRLAYAMRRSLQSGPGWMFSRMITGHKSTSRHRPSPLPAPLMLKRLKVFTFTKKNCIPKAVVPGCACCCAAFILRKKETVCPVAMKVDEIPSGAARCGEVSVAQAESWTSFLQQLSLGHLAPIFEENGIDGQLVCELSQDVTRRFNGELGLEAAASTESDEPTVGLSHSMASALFSLLLIHPAGSTMRPAKERLWLPLPCLHFFHWCQVCNSLSHDVVRVLQKKQPPTHTRSYGAVRAPLPPNPMLGTAGVHDGLQKKQQF